MRARGGANDAIRTLLDLAPRKAVVLRDGEPVEVPTAEVVVSDLLLVRPGSTVAVDGVVEDGESEIDESMVAGESLLVHKGPDSAVVGATINTNGTLRVRATKVGAHRPGADRQTGPACPELQGPRPTAGGPGRGLDSLRAERFENMPGYGAIAHGRGDWLQRCRFAHRGRHLRTSLPPGAWPEIAATPECLM